MKYSCIRFPAVLFLVLTVSRLGFNQGGGLTTSISGVVMDESGGVVPGAEVAVKNSATSSEAV
jgi:hypothetical protein